MHLPFKNKKEASVKQLLQTQRRPPYSCLCTSTAAPYHRAVPALLPPSLDALEAHEIPPEYDSAALRKFIDETKLSEGAELANAQSIFSQLCTALKLPAPKLKKAGADNSYVFEEDVKDGKRLLRIDAYKRGHFIFEAKQGINAKTGTAKGTPAKTRTGHTKNAKGAGVRGTTEWLDAMRAGRHQAGNYAANVVLRGDPKPPFLLVADVGHCLWIWSSFSVDAKDDYGDFEPLARFSWEDLHKPEVARLLRQIWLEPNELNEEARGQRITSKIATLISQLAVRLENRSIDSEEVGDFLMKCVFTMFSEDVGFLPLGLFTQRLKTWEQEARNGHPERFVRGLRALWTKMRDGGDLESGDTIRHFNGYLFRDPDPIKLDAEEIDVLLTAAKADWRRVSPAIFGTLLERALSKKERHQLGAHYTPEAYIRRLVDKTIMAPLRAEWTATRAEMELLLRRGKDTAKATEDAIKLGHAFRLKLSSVRVLDPACGSGNFLYVSLKELKRLEGEVIRALYAAGDRQDWFDMPGNTVHPEQFYGIEIKPWAAKIAELVLWIGYLQWQVSAGRLDRMKPPLLQDLQHIKNTDALISVQKTQTLLDDDGEPILRARGVTDKKSERKMVEVEQLVGVKMTTWPDVDFIIGNPPFLGNKRLSDVLNPGYVEAIREAYPEVPHTADLVMYWWWRCAELVRQRSEATKKPDDTAPKSKDNKGKSPKSKAPKNQKATPLSLRFGLVTTNSITQKFNRAVVEQAAESGSVKLDFAIPDHPWYDEGAAVRIAMTVGAAEAQNPTIGRVVNEAKTKAADLDYVRISETQVSEIHPDLSTGAKATSAQSLLANERLCYQGVNPVGEGFRLSPKELHELGYSDKNLPPAIKKYIIGRDLAQKPEERFIIDFYGIEPEEAQKAYPLLWERIIRLVKKEREHNNRESRKKNWWLFGEPVGKLRAALADLKVKYIATCRTARHRVFQFVDVAVIPDTKIVAIALQEDHWLAILSSRAHVAWALRSGGWLGVGNDSTYNHIDCFGKFPFPSLNKTQLESLTSLGDRLEKHRKNRQQAHPELTITDMYNVLVKVRAGVALNADDDKIRDKALIDTLKQIHDDIDSTVLAAYGWPQNITEPELLQRLVELNATRAQEEAQGITRWLRPSYQAADGPTIMDPNESEPESNPPTKSPTKRKPAPKASTLTWPSDMPARIRILTEFLRAAGEPMETGVIASAFKGAKIDDVDITLRCAAAADAIIMTETGDGETAWASRAS